MLDRPAMHYFASTLTWAEVGRASDALAVALQEHGVGRGDRVAVQLQNMPQFLIALEATWKAGAIFVPVNPMLTPRERAVILDDSGARLLIALESLAGDIDGAVTTSELDYLDEIPPLLARVKRNRGPLDLLGLIDRHDGERPDPVTHAPDDVALLTYTSGTTGPPKGAMNTHANVAFNARSYRDWIGLTEDDVVLAIAPLFHITGLIGHLAVARLVGMPVVLGYRFDARTMLELAQRHGATFTVGAITAFIALMRDAGDLGADEGLQRRQPRSPPRWSRLSKRASAPTSTTSTG